MNYKSKRMKAGISTYTMAKELGVDEKKYKNLERGVLELNGKLLDKFMNVISKSREIKFNRKTKIHEINEWINSGQAEKDIKNTGYNQIEIGEMIGVSNSTICHLLKDKKGSDDVKEKLYDFTQNPLNKKVEDKKRDKKSRKQEGKKIDFVVVDELHEIEDKPQEIEIPSHDIEVPVKLVEETETEKTCECCVDVDKNEYIDKLKEEIFDLKKENMFLKESIKRLFNI